MNINIIDNLFINKISIKFFNISNEIQGLLKIFYFI